MAEREQSPSPPEAGSGVGESPAGEQGRPSAVVVEGVTIERGVPIPAVNARSALGRIVDAMGIGDSVMCETESDMERMRAQFTRRGMKICRRKVAGKGWRVWRVE